MVLQSSIKALMVLQSSTESVKGESSHLCHWISILTGTVAVSLHSETITSLCVNNCSDPVGHSDTGINSYTQDWGSSSISHPMAIQIKLTWLPGKLH